MLRIKGGSKIPQEIIIPSPSFGINYALNGGFATGRFHQIWGTAGAGKSCLFLHTMATAQQMGYVPWIVDAEGAITDRWTEYCGIDLSGREYIRSNTSEHILKELIPEMKKGYKMALLVDSINTIEFERFYDTPDGGSGMAGGARARKEFLQKLAEYMHPENNIVFIVNQQYRDLGAYGAPLSGKLSEAERHWGTTRIKIFASSAKDSLERDNTEKILRRKITWTIEKSRQSAVEGMKGNYFFCPQTAEIDRNLELLDIAKLSKIIEQKGPYFYFNGQTLQGEAKLRAYLDEVGYGLLEDALDKADLRFETEDD